MNNIFFPTERQVHNAYVASFGPGDSSPTDDVEGDAIEALADELFEDRKTDFEHLSDASDWVAYNDPVRYTNSPECLEFMGLVRDAVIAGGSADYAEIGRMFVLVTLEKLRAACHQEAEDIINGDAS